MYFYVPAVHRYISNALNNSLGIRQKNTKLKTTLTSSTKGAAKEANTILKCFLLANIFLF